MKKQYISLLFLMAATLAGCHSYTLASKKEDTLAKMYYLPRGRANIYVYRNEIFGAAISMKLILDGIPVTTTGPKTFIKISVLPGSHVLSSKAENMVHLTINAREGENYFVWQEVKMGMWSARSKLHLVNESKGRHDIRECRLIKTAP